MTSNDAPRKTPLEALDEAEAALREQRDQVDVDLERVNRARKVLNGEPLSPGRPRRRRARVTA